MNKRIIKKKGIYTTKEELTTAYANAKTSTEKRNVVRGVYLKGCTVSAIAKLFKLAESSVRRMIEPPKKEESVVFRSKFVRHKEGA